MISATTVAKTAAAKKKRIARPHLVVMFSEENLTDTLDMVHTFDKIKDEKARI